jgi:hypothetical protein
MVMWDQTIDATAKSGLAASRRPRHKQDLTRSYPEIDLINSRMVRPFISKGNIAKFDVEVH